MQASAPKQIGYCTNVHAGADVQATRKNLAEHALAVKREVCPDRALGVGLWLSAQAARQLCEGEQTAELAAWLHENGVLPFTMNGFPYGDFHQTVVKHDVYLPTWRDTSRRDYTLDLIQILDRLLPTGLDGSISTLPIQWGTPRPSSSELTVAADQLLQVADHLSRLEQERGRLIYVCLEPEPGCVLQRTEDVIHFFEEYLLSAGDEGTVRRHLRVCHDVCHAAVMFEDQTAVLDRYRAHGIAVGKVQVSSAVIVPFAQIPPAERALALEQLRAFSEDRYLHQTMVQPAPGARPVFFEDLPNALDLVERPDELTGSWRVHFHVPVYLERFGLLQTSRDDIAACVQAAEKFGDIEHWEVETYAWSVLPDDLKTNTLAEGISRELQWFQPLFPTQASSDA